DGHVTGVQTCALPIWRRAHRCGRQGAYCDPETGAGSAGSTTTWTGPRQCDRRKSGEGMVDQRSVVVGVDGSLGSDIALRWAVERSEERRVGKEGRGQW